MKGTVAGSAIYISTSRLVDAALGSQWYDQLLSVLSSYPGTYVLPTSPCLQDG